MTNETEAPELLPCPFCGGGAIYYRDPTTEATDSIYCQSCDACVSDFNIDGPQGSCKDLWNTRADAKDVWPNFKAPPMYSNPHPDWVDTALPDFRLIWSTAKLCGYAIGLHGSMKRDVDLIATPWTDSAEEPDRLINDLCRALNARMVGGFEKKPFGRFAVTIQIDGFYKAIDLSIMPKEQTDDQ